MVKSLLYKKIYGCLLGGLIGDAMGAPVEGWHYEKIEKQHGQICDFKGEGTDDSAIKLILCKAIIENDGYAGPDEFARSFLSSRDKYDLFFIPVKNMFHKLETGTCLPVDAGAGNMQSSSSAMSISPMGLINACDPRRAALETFQVAGLIHSGSTGFCRDAACAMSAAVAEAMKPDATVNSILRASVEYLNKKSAAEIRENIQRALDLADKAGEYGKFRKLFYGKMLREIICDSRETVPAELALFSLAKGNPVKAIIYSANFGRDADTIGTMAGSLAGAFRGAGALKPEWVKKIEAKDSSQAKLTLALLKVIKNRADESELNRLSLRKIGALS